MTIRAVGLALCVTTLSASQRTAPAAPTFQYTSAPHVCASARLGAFNDSGTEAIWVDINVMKLAPTPGRPKVVNLPDASVNARVQIGTNIPGICGDVFRGTPEYVEWPAVRGRLTITANAPEDPARPTYFVSVEIKDLIVKGPGGVIAKAPSSIKLAGRAGMGPGGH